MLPVSNIGGLISGLDTNSIVSQLMDIERIPLRHLESRKKSYESKDTAWQSITTRLSALHTALGDIDRTGDWNKLVIATSSDPDAVSVTASGEASPGSFGFTVDQLATSHQVASASTFASAGDVVGAGTFTISIDGADKTVTTGDGATLTDLARGINDLDAGVHATVLSVDGSTVQLLITADETGTDHQFTASGTQTGLGSFDIIQQAADAQLTVGQGTGAITITRQSNTISDLVAGVTIDLKATTTGPVTVTTSRDLDTAVEKVTAFVNELNATLDELGNQSAYNADADTAAPLVGDSTVRQLMFDLTAKVSYAVSGASGSYAYAGGVGISVNREGRFELDETKLRDAMETDFGAVQDLFTEIASTTDTRAVFSAAGTSTVDGTYDVVISQAARAAAVTGTAYAPSTQDETFDITSGSTVVTVTIGASSSLAQAVQQINDTLDTAGVTTLRASDDGGALKLSEARYGSTYGFDVGTNPFGLTGSFTGADVAGTIGGETATGSGRTLTADTGAPTGLKLTITASQSEVDAAGGSLPLGSVTFGNGIAGRLDRYLDTTEGVDGTVQRARDRYKNQIDLIDDQIQRMEDRLDQKEALLIQQFSRLETAMNQLTAMGSALGAQLSSLMGGA